MAEKKLTGKIARERIRLMATPRPPEGIIDGFRALGDASWNCVGRDGRAWASPA